MSIDMTDLEHLIKNQETAYQEAKKEFHIHQRGKVGASDLGACCFVAGLKRAGYKMPEMTGLKGERGAMEVGDIHHNHYQDQVMAIEEQNNLAINCGKDLPRQHYNVEIMVTVPLTEKTIIESPIDVGLAEGTPAFENVMFEFKNVKREVPVLAPNAKWLKIWDIKSESNYGFWRTIKEGVPFRWKAQFHAYMKATGLKELTVIIIHKEKNWKRYIVVPWEDAVWERMIAIAKRKEALAEEFMAHPEVTTLTKADLEYFGDGIQKTEDVDSICWMWCPLSETREEVLKSGEPKLKLVKPCSAACDFLKKDAREKLRVGDLWKYGSSKVTITAIDWDKETLVAVNKGGKQFDLTIYEALNDFEVDKPKA